MAASSACPIGSNNENTNPSSIGQNRNPLEPCRITNTSKRSHQEEPDHFVARWTFIKRQNYIWNVWEEN
jgi:hypothetical protein